MSNIGLAKIDSLIIIDSENREEWERKREVEKNGSQFIDSLAQWGIAAGFFLSVKFKELAKFSA